MKSVLISGAGIAGPTLAFWLRRQGLEPVIVERSPQLRTGGYMIDFWGVGFDVAERMGLVPRLRQDGYVFGRVVFVAADGHVKSELRTSDLGSGLQSRFVSLLRGDLARIVYDAIDPPVETILGDWITGIDDCAGQVDVAFASGLARSFDFVVGADGLHSNVRSLMFGPEEPFRRFLGYYAASFIVCGYSPRDEDAYVSHASPGRQISRYALRDGRTAFLLIFAADRPIPGLTHQRQKTAILQAFSDEVWEEWPEIRYHLGRAESLYFDEVSQIEMPSWSKGRCVLIGDAAYCPSLLSGQGSALAMAGAYVLAGEIGRCGDDWMQAFRTYEDRLRPFIAGKQRSARSFASSFTPRTAFGIGVRDAVLNLSRIPFVSRLISRSFVDDQYALPDYG